MLDLSQVDVVVISDRSQDPVLSFNTEEIVGHDQLLSQAQSIVASLKDGFQWKDLLTILTTCFKHVQANKHLSIIEQKQQIITILDHVIDLTDTPYLPDYYTDPLFKSLIPPMVDVMSRVFNSEFIPIIIGEKPTKQTFITFSNNIQQTFANGFQWSDLIVCVEKTALFVAGFSALSLEEKKQAAIDVIDALIDITDTPFVPDAIADPIFKALAHPLVEWMLDKTVAH